MRLFWITAALSGIISFLTDRLAAVVLTHRISILGSFAGLELSFNPGIAWGVRLPAGIQEAAIWIALFVVVILAYRTSDKRQVTRGKSLVTDHLSLATFSYGLIVGGGIANIIDRLGDGVVTDFLQVGTFPVFNVADSCVTVGVGLLLLAALMDKKHVVKSK